MENLYKLKKEELIASHKRLQSENKRLEDELDRLSDCYTEMENKLADAVNSLESDDVIKSVYVFKFRLQIEGLLTPEMETFIENYLKFYNETRG